MSATTGIHSGVYGDPTIPWTDWRERTRKRTISKKRMDQGPSSWLSFASEMVLAVIYTLAMLPLMVVGTFVALVLAAWAILAPALIAGFVLVLVSFLATAL